MVRRSEDRGSGSQPAAFALGRPAPSFVAGSREVAQPGHYAGLRCRLRLAARGVSGPSVDSVLLWSFVPGCLRRDSVPANLN